jgi:hypothetical protein
VPLDELVTCATISAQVTVLEAAVDDFHIPWVP